MLILAVCWCCVVSVIVRLLLCVVDVARCRCLQVADIVVCSCCSLSCVVLLLFVLVGDCICGCLCVRMCVVAGGSDCWLWLMLLLLIVVCGWLVVVCCY